MRDSQLHWLNWAELSNPLNKPSSSSSQDVLSLLLCILKMPFDLVFSSCGWKLGHFGLAHLNGALLMLMRPSEPHCIALHWPALHCIAWHRPNSRGFNLLSFNHDDKISAPSHHHISLSWFKMKLLSPSSSFPGRIAKIHEHWVSFAPWKWNIR